MVRLSKLKQTAQVWKSTSLEICLDFLIPSGTPSMVQLGQPVPLQEALFACVEQLRLSYERRGNSFLRLKQELTLRTSTGTCAKICFTTQEASVDVIPPSWVPELRKLCGCHQNGASRETQTIARGEVVHHQLAPGPGYAVLFGPSEPLKRIFGWRPLLVQLLGRDSNLWALAIAAIRGHSYCEVYSETSSESLACFWSSQSSSQSLSQSSSQLSSQSPSQSPSQSQSQSSSQSVFAGGAKDKASPPTVPSQYSAQRQNARPNCSHFLNFLTFTANAAFAAWVKHKACAPTVQTPKPIRSSKTKGATKLKQQLECFQSNNFLHFLTCTAYAARTSAPSNKQQEALTSVVFEIQLTRSIEQMSICKLS